MKTKPTTWTLPQADGSLPTVVVSDKVVHKPVSTVIQTYLMSRTFVIAILLLALSFRVSAQATIFPGGDLYDTNGNIVHAVEGGVIKVGNLYYLWGMDRSQNNYTFRGVNLYSSPDLKTWTFVNTILKNTSHPDLGNDAVVERPKLLHNTSTGQFVLWMHYEGWNAYSTAEVAYATSSTIGGNYTFQSHFRPLGLDSRDMNTYKDTDGKAYLISSIAINSQVSIMELNASYTAPVREVFRGYASNGIGCEGHAIIKNNGTYYWIQSLCTGWDTNDNRYFTATSLAGPWTSKGNIAPSGAKTYQSQVTYAFQVTGSSGTSYVYMGDRWSKGNFSLSRLILLPLQVSAGTSSLPWYDQWTINTSTGTWTGGSQIVWNGRYRIVNRNSGQVIDVPGWSTADGTLIKQWPTGGGANQQWTIQNLGRGEYRITNVHSGKVLEIPGSPRDLGKQADQWPWNGGYNQKWHIVACKGGYYRLVNVNTLGKTIEVAGASTANSANIVLGDFNYSNHQQWQFVLVPAARISSEEDESTKEYAAYPSPFTTTISIPVSLKKAESITLKVYNALGMQVSEKTFGKLEAGSHQLEWNGSHVQTGLYTYKIWIDGKLKTGKLLKSDF